MDACIKRICKVKRVLQDGIVLVARDERVGRLFIFAESRVLASADLFPVLWQLIVACLEGGILESTRESEWVRGGGRRE